MDINGILNQPAFVIHIESYYPDRTAFFTKNIKEAGFTNMQVFEGVHAKTPGEIDKCIGEFGNVKLHKDLSPGQIGCLLSHLKCYKHIIENNIPICTIFEDDVLFHPDWSKLAPIYFKKTPKNFDIIFMGNQVDEIIPLTLDTITKVDYIHSHSCFCMHAYTITLAGAKKVLNYLLNWDYSTALTDGEGKQLTGLFPVDVMLKNIQERINNKKLYPILKWYCWNGTRFQCEDNRVPISKYNNTRNTGLVFQEKSFMLPKL